MLNKTIATLTLLTSAMIVSAGEKPLVMTRYTVTDVERNGRQPLLIQLVPQGWKAEHKIEWTRASTTFPFALWAKYASPDGKAVVEVFPVYQGSLHSSPFGNQGHGGPKDALEGLAAIALQLRPNVKMKLVAKNTSEAKTETVRSQAGITQNTHQVASLTVVYMEGDQEIVEEFAGSYYLTTTETGVGYSTRFWAMHDVRSIRSTKAQFQEVRAIGVGMLRSARPTPEFLKAVEIASQCVRNIAQNDRDMRAFEQQVWLRTQREINDTWRKTTEERWAIQDKHNEQFRDLIGNVNRFKSNGGYEVLLPTTHKHAWEGPNGTYLLTDDPNYRPDNDFTGRWTRLEPKW